jgi:pimeloyl-ACP methyl ester carboxylesterase
MKCRPASRGFSDNTSSEPGQELSLLPSHELQPKAVAGQLVLSTNHGRIALRQTAGQRLPILFLHGGGLCKEIFDRQLESSLGNQHRMIAIDLPGHGESTDAPDPRRSYSVEGLADLALEVLERLEIDTAVVVGVSLGGRVALELARTFPGLIGIGVTGVPISSRSHSPLELAEFGLAGELPAPEERIERFLRLSFGDVDASAFRAPVARADQKCLDMVTAELRSGSGHWPTSRDIANIPILSIAGANGLATTPGREFESRRAQSRFSIIQSGPAPFIQVPEIYNHILGRFMARMVRRESQILSSPSTWYGG